MDSKNSNPPNYQQPASNDGQFAPQAQYAGQTHPMQPMPAAGYHMPTQGQPGQYPPHGQPQGQNGYMNQQQPGPQPQIGTAGGPGIGMPYATLQSDSKPVWCPSCNRTVNTVTTFEAGNVAHAIAAALCCTTGCCCWIPYVFNGCQDVVHRCPSCPTVFATFHRSGRTEAHMQ